MIPVSDGLGYVLSTGRVFYANLGIIGINPTLEVSEGYDGGFSVDGDWEGEDKWTAAERAELADFMIDLWQRFKGQAC